MIESVQKQLEHSLSVLAVESSHSWDDIEKQYRQLIQRWHPDRNSDENSDTAQSKFIEINSAYKVVKAYYQKNADTWTNLPTCTCTSDGCFCPCPANIAQMQIKMVVNCLHISSPSSF